MVYGNPEVFEGFHKYILYVGTTGRLTKGLFDDADSIVMIKLNTQPR